jgi:hypothetical protein
LILLDLMICGGELVFAIHMAWFEGELVPLPCILYILLFSCIFLILTQVTLLHMLYWLVFA